MQKNPLCVVSLADSPITSPEQLVGKKIGVAQGNQAGWEVFLKRAGVDVSEITVVPVQYDPSPVANKEVDGQVVFSINEPAQLKVKGIETNVLLFADYGFDIYAGCYFALEQTIEEAARGPGRVPQGRAPGLPDGVRRPARRPPTTRCRSSARTRGSTPASSWSRPGCCRR